jgi:hypothetical protein
MTLRTILFIALTVGGAVISQAETIVVDDQVQLRESTVDRPARGMTMGAVEQRFGAPATKHNTVGQPPITRWDYQGFAVFFERDRVIHAVATS